MNDPELPFSILSELDGKPEPVAASLKDVISAAEVLRQTDCMNPSAERLRALNVMKSAIDRIEPQTYRDFCEYGIRYPEKDLPRFYEEHPALYWYDRSFDQVLDCVRNVSVPEGQVFLHLVYNMGYVVKTPSKCFAVDLHHRRAEELVPHLDFCCITHNHSDHYTQRFASAMNLSGKPVVTNFFANDGYPGTDDAAGYSKGPERTLDFGDVTVKTYESDHNAKLRRFVQPVELQCRTGHGVCVIFSSGDSCNAEQVTASVRPDFWLVHPYVGLKIADGAARLDPALTLCSHLMEFHHSIDRFRWTYRQGYEAARKVWETGRAAVVPVWGDRIVFRQGDADKASVSGRIRSGLPN